MRYEHLLEPEPQAVVELEVESGTTTKGAMLCEHCGKFARLSFSHKHGAWTCFSCFMLPARKP